MNLQQCITDVLHWPVTTLKEWWELWLRSFNQPLGGSGNFRHFSKSWYGMWLYYSLRPRPATLFQGTVNRPAVKMLMPTDPKGPSHWPWVDKRSVPVTSSPAGQVVQLVFHFQDKERKTCRTLWAFNLTTPVMEPICHILIFKKMKAEGQPD